LTEQVAEVHDDLELLLAIVTQLDLANARARYSLWLEANPPGSFSQKSKPPCEICVIPCWCGSSATNRGQR
jgi:hypothetical protein